jgi:putative transposase
MPRPKKPASPFCYFNSSSEVIRLVVMMYVRFPLSLRNVEDLLAERGIDICHETVRHWWNRFGPLFAADVRRQRVSRMKGFRQWKWHLDEVYVNINGEMHCLWRAVDQEGEILESYVTRTRDKQAALAFMKKALKRHGSADPRFARAHWAYAQQIGGLETKIDSLPAGSGPEPEAAYEAAQTAIEMAIATTDDPVQKLLYRSALAEYDRMRGFSRSPRKAVPIPGGCVLASGAFPS